MIGCALMAALGLPTAAGAARTGETVKLTAGGRTTDVVAAGTEVRVRAVESGTVPADQRPAAIYILGGYQTHGQTQARLLKRCSGTRCEIDPAIRIPTTWTYQAFVVGHGGTELAKSRIVTVEWVRPGSTATGP